MQDILKDRNAKMLIKLATHPKSLKRTYHYSDGKVFTKYGCVYVTDGYLIGRIEYSDYFTSDDDFHFLDYDFLNHKFISGENAEIEFYQGLERNITRKPNFEDFDLHMFNVDELVKICEFFRINKINPTIYVIGEFIEISGHNDDVSALFRLIGMR